MNRPFSEEIARDHFVVKIELINQDGIWGTHPYSKELVSFFRMEHIISIHREIEIDPANPKHATMLADIEQKTGQKVEGDLRRIEKPTENTGPMLPVLEEAPAPMEVEQSGDASFVDIGVLERLAEFSKRTFDVQDLTGKNKF